MWRIADVLSMNQLIPVSRSAVNQERGAPNSHQHPFITVVEMAMEVDKRVIHQLRMNGGEHINIYRGLSLYRGFLNPLPGPAQRTSQPTHEQSQLPYRFPPVN